MQIDPDFAGRRIRIGDFQQQAALIAGGEEAGQAGRQHDGIANDHITRGRAHTRFRPHHGHDPERAVEGRQIEARARRAVGADFHRAGEEAHKLFRGRRRGGAGIALGIAARAHPAHGAVHAVDQAAIEIADLHAEASLAKVMAGRIGAFEAGHVENAEIHCGDGGIGLLARLHIGNPQRHIERPARADFSGEGKARREPVIAGIDSGVGKAEGAGRIVFRGNIHRANDRGRHVGAGAPFIGNRQLDDVFPGGDINRLHVDQPVGHHRDQGLARRARHEAQARRIAGAVGGAVERNLQHIGRGGGIGGGIPAGSEGDGRGHILPASPLCQALHPDLVFAPFDGRRYLKRRILGNDDFITLDKRAGRDRLPVPPAAALIPLVAGIDAVDGIAHRYFGGIAARIEGDQAEAGGAVFRHHVIKKGPDADHRCCRGKRAGDLALHGPSRALRNAHRDGGFERVCGGFSFGEDERDQGLAGLVGADADRQGFAAWLEGLIVAPEAVAGMAFDLVARIEAQFTLDAHIGGRCAKEVARLEREGRRSGRIERAFGKRKGEIDPLGDEILHEEFGCCQGGRIGIGMKAEAPAAALGRGADRKGKHMPAGEITGGNLARVFDAVGAAQDGGEGDAFERFRLRPAQQSGNMHGIPGAIGAAVRRHEGIDRLRGRAPLHAAIGKIEGGTGKGEEGDIPILLTRDQERGRPRARAGRDRRRKAGITARVRLRFGQHRICPREQGNLHPLFRRGLEEGADEHMNAVHPLQAGHSEIREGKPLRAGGVVIWIGARHPGFERIDPGRQSGNDLAHGQAGSDLAVELHPHLALAAPDLLRHIAGEALGFPDRERAGEIAILHGAQKIAIADPAQHEIHFGQVDGFDRQGRIRRPWQHIAAPRETGDRPAIAHVVTDRHRFQKLLAIRGRQPGAEGDLVALSMFQPAHADLALSDLDRHVVGRQFQIGPVIEPRLHQIFREGCADARLGEIAVDRILDDAKAVFRDRPLKCFRDRRIIHEVAGEGERGDHVAPAAIPFERPCHDHERRSLFPRPFAAQPGIHCSRQGFGADLPVSFRFLAGNFQSKLRISDPEPGPVGQHEGGAGIAERLGGILAGIGFTDQLFRVRLGGEIKRGDALGQIARGCEIRFMEKIRLPLANFRAGNQGSGRFHHPPRDRARIRALLFHRAFGKAGIGAPIVGEGLAALVKQAGAAAALEGLVKQGGQIGAVEIDILAQDMAPLGDRAFGLCVNPAGNENCCKNESNKKTHRDSPNQHQ